eukprot:8258839-Lingulodinium_polyedra.AAC.1
MDLSPFRVGRIVFGDREAVNAIDDSMDESRASSDAESIASIDITSVTPGSPASSDNESVAVDRPRGRFGSAP